MSYLFTGGFKADVRTDVVEFFFMFAGFGIIIPFCFAQYGGLDFLRAQPPPLHLTWHGGNDVQYIVVWFFIALWTFVDPSFHQRCYAAKDGRTAQEGHPRLGRLLVPLRPDDRDDRASTPGPILPGLAEPVMAYPLLAETVLPPVAKGLFFAGILATIMSTLNTAAFVSAQTLGRDIVWRIDKERCPPLPEEADAVGIGGHGCPFVGTGAPDPSVIQLWYTIGTVIIPGLLVPLVGVILKNGSPSPIRVCLDDARLADLDLWLLVGWREQLGGSESYPFGIEPMYPGLTVSVVLWWVGWRGRKG